MADVPNTTPDVCHVCGERAHGVGLQPDRRGDPIRWLCVSCSLLLEDIHRVKRMDAVQRKAREGGMEAAGAIIEAYGTDLGEYTEEQALELVGACWKGTADRIREIIRTNESPF